MDQEKINHYLDQDHLADVKQAQDHLAPIIKKTALIKSDFYSSEYGGDIYIKPENLQMTGSFKIRGAYHKICRLSTEELEKGIITSSAGNHAQGVAFSAQRMGIKATIIMPNITPLLKVDATKSYGVDVVLHGDVYDESYDYACQLAKEEGYTFIHPFDDYDVICGQGTIGLEILSELPDADEILVPIGGGGLVAGIAIAAKAINPGIRIIGVEPMGACSMRASINEGRVACLPSVCTNAEGVAVKQPGDLSYALTQKYVDELITVSEKDIQENVLLVMEKHKLVAETAGVVALAGLKKRAAAGKKIVCVMSGGNIDTVTISSIVNQGMISRGRIMCFAVELPDKPGQLVKVATLLAENGANVIELEHNQFKALDRYANKVMLEVTVETNGHDHIDCVLAALRENGFSVNRIY